MSGFSAFDHACMTEALRLAERGLWTTDPNPRVGCVIAREDRIVGRGWHQRAGGPHAEVFALREAGEAARGATAYVTLEPCAHHGRTPPCAEALVAAGVERVAVAAHDPFPEVDGRGSERLRAAGIEVEHGLLQDQARELNIGFFSRIERGRPWLRLKLASSLDGRTGLANGESKWITGEAARADVQRWRARSSAVMTGSATVRADDPALTARVDAELAAPVRIVVCGEGGVPIGARLLADGLAPVWLAGPKGSLAELPRCEQIELPAAERGVDLSALLMTLGERGINELQVECGARLAGALLRGGWVDELLLYQAPCVLGSGARPLFDDIDLTAMMQRFRFETVDRRFLGDDLRWRLRPLSDHQRPEETPCSPD
ncbi:bifunctional diaminohydroxyphosphoribosylaminopyrimidine deaminase/5-amino-6-(5-phosphoribosylamino)uracil reductase RibD [Pseudomarimonas salicorniae]|uniref:Riboflavin biosynthesis protein RibD n=1 Tax=Pseudomarimonas salicorniae TaxID=2933270 RepID=A0ABT0GK58_9GAMM|nr:bifunctional diaminohydroxyphosphoribosylaminopyrimidine deaminase/5-amino-6-(5-phosphoribosylamino)uracil reductase RibD [Lysobacter sp. CAU 1642]MCK7594599.1 bifunctional diaminohydroxyphosphoribosylaminopyrimidine deaminase/5-amino-6-(5-phosphoribosylamino)uracil reductase RibD [Lysobacter sp. CAU 1642]